MILAGAALAGEEKAAGAYRSVSSRAVVAIAHLLHPIDHLPLECLLDGDVRHGALLAGSVPVLFIRGKPDDVARVYSFNLAAIALHPAATGNNNKCLSKRMRVPRGARPRFESNQRSPSSRRRLAFEKWINSNLPAEPISGTFSGRCRSIFGDFHFNSFLPSVGLILMPDVTRQMKSASGQDSD